MKFNPGDPVWAKTSGKWPNIPAGEYAATVVRFCRGNTFIVQNKFWSCSHTAEDPGYVLDIPTAPCPFPNEEWCAHECYLRPRRDDYQQHEGLGSMDKITDPLPLSERSFEDYTSIPEQAHR